MFEYFHCFILLIVTINYLLTYLLTYLFAHLNNSRNLFTNRYLAPKQIIIEVMIDDDHEYNVSNWIRSIYLRDLLISQSSRRPFTLCSITFTRFYWGAVVAKDLPRGWIHTLVTFEAAGEESLGQIHVVLSLRNAEVSEDALGRWIYAIAPFMNLKPS